MKKLATFAMLVVLGCFVFGCLGCGEKPTPEKDPKEPPIAVPPAPAD